MLVDETIIRAREVDRAVYAQNLMDFLEEHRTDVVKDPHGLLIKLINKLESQIETGDLLRNGRKAPNLKEVYEKRQRY